MNTMNYRDVRIKELEAELKQAKDSEASVTRERDELQAQYTEAIDAMKVALELLRNVSAIASKCERKIFSIVEREWESEKKGGE